MQKRDAFLIHANHYNCSLSYSNIIIIAVVNNNVISW